ncbi:hypothetical protein [Mucilaginibacter sp. dw_454]|uniref:hypothetical protein n=1 Tax=Mucilaginibacter sp. dw_454 TaxID=2720079 RepID=UPI001BD2DF7D|nr:hypothetical protein [Mucilaginibacter sp. dw_454]
MTGAAIKMELHDRIEHADEKQIKELYGLMLNYFNGQDDDEGWGTLSLYHQERLKQSIKEADAGLGTSANEIIKQSREKYGLNG